MTPSAPFVLWSRGHISVGWLNSHDDIAPMLVLGCFSSGSCPKKDFMVLQAFDPLSCGLSAHAHFLPPDVALSCRE